MSKIRPFALVRQCPRRSLPTRFEECDPKRRSRIVAGVLDVKPYENYTGITDGNQASRHTPVCIVVNGGDLTAVATRYHADKNPWHPDRIAPGRRLDNQAVALTDPNGMPINPSTSIRLRMQQRPLTFHNHGYNTHRMVAAVCNGHSRTRWRFYLNSLPIRGDRFIRPARSIRSRNLINADCPPTPNEGATLRYHGAYDSAERWLGFGISRL